MFLKNIKRLILPSFIFIGCIALYFFSYSLFEWLGIEEPTLIGFALEITLQVLIWLAGCFFIYRLSVFLLFEKFWRDNDPEKHVPAVTKNVLGAFLFAITLLCIWAYVFDQKLTGVLATSGVVGIVLGFALRPVITDLFLGVAINFEKTYQIGDWIEVVRPSGQEVIGQVMEINWRTTKIRTIDQHLLSMPNSLIGLRPIKNLTDPFPSGRYEVQLTVDFSIPTERVRRILVSAVNKSLTTEGFDPSFEPKVLVKKVASLGVEYEIWFWIKPFCGIPPDLAKDVVYSNALKFLQLAGITPAYPKQDIYHEPMPIRQFDCSSPQGKEFVLRQVPLFAPLNNEEISLLAQKLCVENLPKKKILIQKGDKGESMFILVEGVMQTMFESDTSGTVSKAGKIYPGDFVGEMSLFTGEPRSATLVALTDLVLFEVTKNDFETLLKNRKELSETISRIVAERKLKLGKFETSQKIIKTIDEQKLSADILTKMRYFFRDTFA